MNIENINDECSTCGNRLECKLFVEGHGINQERTNVTKMIVCQMNHRRKREGAASELISKDRSSAI